MTWKKTKDSVVLDTARLLADQPDLLKTYGMQRQGSRRFVLAIHPRKTNVAVPNPLTPHRQPDGHPVPVGNFI